MQPEDETIDRQFLFPDPPLALPHLVTAPEIRISELWLNLFTVEVLLLFAIQPHATMATCIGVHLNLFGSHLPDSQPLAEAVEFQHELKLSLNLVW